MRRLDGITDSMDMSLSKLWGVGDGQEGLVCCSPWGHKGSDTIERLNWTEMNWTELNWTEWLRVFVNPAIVAYSACLVIKTRWSVPGKMCNHMSHSGHVPTSGTNFSGPWGPGSGDHPSSFFFQWCFLTVFSWKRLLWSAWDQSISVFYLRGLLLSEELRAKRQSLQICQGWLKYDP